MLFVSVPKEIREYEPKLIAGLSARQLGWGAVALGLGFATFFITRTILPQSIYSWLVMASVAIPFTCGFIKIKDLPADLYFRLMLKFIWESRKPLVYNNGSDGGGLKHDLSKEEKKRLKTIRKDREKFKKTRSEIY